MRLVDFHILAGSHQISSTTMDSLHIRKAKLEDAPVLIALQQKMAWATEGLSLNEDTVSKGVKTLLGDASKGQYYVAEFEGEIVGCLLTTPEWSEWRNGTVLWIQSVYVREAFRNQGVFRTLYSFIKSQVENDDSLMGIRLYVDKSNLSAQEVYIKLGMDGQHYQLFEWLKSS